MILRRKLYSQEELEYYSPFKRALEVGKYGLFGAISGGIFGSGIGVTKGGKKGALIGAGIGSALGGLALGRLGVDMTSRRVRENSKMEKEIKKNPKILFKDLDNDFKLISDYKKLESKYGIKFPDQFYKLIKIRKQFIPTLVNLYKKYGKDLDWYSIIYCIDPSYTESWINEEDQKVAALLFDPSQADDTWIVYDLNSKKFGYDVVPGKFNTLKDILLDKLSSDKEYCRYSINPKAQEELINLYLKFIKFKL